jgi:hypothetical protein
MRTPFSKKPGPLETLPAPFRKSLSTPFQAFTIVTAAMIGLLLFGRLFGSEVSASAKQHSTQRRAYASHSSGNEIKVQGNVTLKIKEKDKGYRVYIDSTRYKLEEGGDEIELSSPDTGEKYRLKVKSDKVNLYSPQNSVIFRFVRQEDGDYVLKDTNGAQVFRLKVKSDSYNIYNSSQVRILKGKSKGGYITVKTKPGDRRVLKIDGENRFAPAGALSLPIDAPYRALLWRHLS